METSIITNELTYSITSKINTTYEAMTRAAETIGKEAPPIYQNRVSNKPQDDDSAAHRWYRFMLSFPPHLVHDYLEGFGL